MRKYRLNQAISTAMKVATLAAVGIASASASTTMYNTFNAGLNPDQGTTDGWNYTGGITSDGTLVSTNPSYPNVSPGWVGTANSTTLPFGYLGASILNWAVEITQAGDSVEISRADAVARYTLEADIDTSRGAWRDGDPTARQGWAHNTDIGLFRSAVDAYVTLSPTIIGSPNADVGITIFTGMDTLNHTGSGGAQGSGYTHHTSWNKPTTPDGKDFTTSDPFGTLGVTYVHGLGVGNDGASYAEIVTASNPFTFLAQANQVYSIYLGGNSADPAHTWSQARSAYSLSITTAPVPIPAAAWLMGSGLLGILGFARRKPRT